MAMISSQFSSAKTTRHAMQCFLSLIWVEDARKCLMVSAPTCLQRKVPVAVGSRTDQIILTAVTRGYILICPDTFISVNRRRNTCVSIQSITHLILFGAIVSHFVLQQSVALIWSLDLFSATMKRSATSETFHTKGRQKTPARYSALRVLPFRFFISTSFCFMQIHE